MVHAAGLDIDKDKILEPLFKEVDRPWRIQAILELPAYSFYLGAPSVNGVSYQPNFAPRLGPKILYKDVGATVTFALPVPSKEKYRRGDSTMTAVLANSYWHQNAMDIYYSRFRGFYVASPFTELSFRKPERYPQLPNARAIVWGVNWYYVFDPEHYSLRAAFDLAEFQLKSGGSWIYNPFFNHFEISVGNEFVPGEGNDSLVALPNLASARMDTLGLTAGYGYTWIVRRLFATAQGTIGPGAQYQRIQRSDGNNTEVASFAAKLNVNMSFGWNDEDHIGGVKFLLDTLWAEVSDTQVYSNLWNIQVFAGYRF
jgi:hypothetical protein